jgi:hypothetical protein
MKFRKKKQLYKTREHKNMQIVIALLTESPKQEK